MTMDPAYISGFQQQQQPSQPLLPILTQQQHANTCMSKSMHSTHKEYETITRNNQRHLFLHHQHGPTQVQTNEPTTNLSSSVLHRPIHPPPPPPPPQPSLPSTQQQHATSRYLNSATTIENIDSINQDYYLEEVIQAILAAKEALEKPIEERDERDILLIDNLCSLVHGFDAFPKSVRRALAAQAVLIVIDEKGKELIVHNEELDSFCVLIFGECEQLNVAKTMPIRYYTVGDAFGVCEPTTEIIRFVGHMITRCENCAFLCVKRDDFYTILTDPANYPNKETLRHRDRNGNVVCVSQFKLSKKSSGPPWSQQMQSNPFKIILPDGHVIVKATESCLLMALVDGYDRLDTEYIDDFMLLFRVFMTYEQKDKDKKLPPGMVKLCRTLAQWLDNMEYRDKVVKIVLTWLSSYYHDFELNSEFSYLFFRVLESRLLNLSMNNQLHLLHVTLSTKSKARHVTISRSSREQPLPFSIAGGYEKNCGIFVTQVNGSNFDDRPNENFERFLHNTNDSSRYSNPLVPPRHRTLQHDDLLWNQKDIPSRTFAQLRPGDQILEVNGTNFAAIRLVEAQKKLDMSTHLSLTVKHNPSAFHEMRALPEGRRKSSLSSVSSVSPYPTAGQKFTFNLHDNPSNHHLNHVHKNGGDSNPSISPLFSTNANFGFRSFIKSVPKNDRSRLSNLISSSKQFVKQIRESTNLQPNMETSSKTSDNISDDQSNDTEVSRSKSSSDLQNLKGKDKQIESGLSTVIRLDDLNPTTITENQSGTVPNQTLVNVLRVFNAANNDFRYLLVHEETTAREVVMVAVKEFNLSSNSANLSSLGEKTISSLNWHLYEVSVVPESKTIKQKCLSEQTNRLSERASLCSRFYIKSNSQSSIGPSRLDMGDDALVYEILKESPPNVTLTSLNATLLAVELTLADFDKFRSIEPQQFVYDTFFNCSDIVPKQPPKFNPNGSLSSQDTASLKSSSSDGQDAADVLHSLNKTRSVPKAWMEEYQQFADISNREMFWVICEILNEKNISRRVKIVKQFVRVADVCSQLRNYNSMFAIISGLGHSCVSRLRRTFDKLKPKYKNQLEKMRSLFDPSKNMSNYRVCLSQTPPPAIPLFPQIKKDLTFTKEGRSIFVRESNDLSDDEDSCGFLQDTIRRVGTNGKTRGCASAGGDLLSVKSATTINSNNGSNIVSNHLHQHHNNHANHLPIVKQRSISYTSFNTAIRQPSSQSNLLDMSDSSILVNFAEIRQFTERVRNVIYFSSIPYSNDLLTNTKDNQRTQAQIKKMHEEWQMRKRIRHYINQTLNGAISDMQQDKQHQQSSSSSSLSSATGSSNLIRGAFDQPDGSQLLSTNIVAVDGKQQQQSFQPSSGKINITYDERTLYQRSLEVEPELNQPSRPQAASEPTRQLPQHSIVQSKNSQSQRPNSSNSQQQSSSKQPQVPPVAVLMNMQPPPMISMPILPPSLPSLANSSPTLSKSSSLSSCSSFSHHHHHHPQQQMQPQQQLTHAYHHHHHHHHHLPPSGYHVTRGGGASAATLNSTSMGKFGTESSESLRKLRLLSENAPDDCRSSFSGSTNSRYNGLGKISGSGDGGQTGSSGTGSGLSAKTLISSRIFPARSGSSSNGAGPSR